MNEDITNKFWDYILIPYSTLRHKPKVSYKCNSIFFKNLLIFGFQGSGKTMTANGIAEQIVRFYNKKNVNSVMSEDGNLEEILSYGFKDKLVNLIFIDNLTLRPVKKETISEYFRCRHILAEKFNRYNGYILSVISLHRFFSIPVELRTNLSGIFLKDSSFNPYDRAFIKRLVGDKALSYLDKLEHYRVEHPELMDNNFFVSKNLNGLVKIPLSKKLYLKEITPSLDILFEGLEVPK